MQAIELLNQREPDVETENQGTGYDPCGKGNVPFTMLIVLPERQVNELHSNSAITNEPATPSHLLRSQSVSEEEPPQIPAVSAAASASIPTEDPQC